jgi:hypothetical protein
MESTQVTPSDPASSDPLALLAERERAIEMLSFLPETKSLTLYCQRTGVAIATMQLMQQAGKLPFLGQWKDSQAYHPLFSLTQNRLLAWTRKWWNNIFKDEVTDRVSKKQQEQFCVAFVAILHNMECIKQDANVRVLPSFTTVQNNMQKLLELAYWHNFLDSKKFAFPTLRITKHNNNSDLGHIFEYLDVCNERKEAYEEDMDDILEDAKLEAAKRAEKAVRSSHIRAVSKKALWNWFVASLAERNSKKYQLAEWVEWKETSNKLFLASESAQLQYSVDDVNSIEDVFLAECSLGSATSHAFRTELEKIRNNIYNHNSIYEIDWLGTIDANKGTAVQRVRSDGVVVSAEEFNKPEDPGEQPNIGQFASRAQFLVAEAKWKIRKMQLAAWEQKYAANQTPSLQEQVEEELSERIDDANEHTSDTDDDETGETGLDTSNEGDSDDE